MSQASTLTPIARSRRGAVLSALLVGGAAVCAEQAVAHMNRLGHICGVDQTAHCGWCYAAGLLAAAGAALSWRTLRRATASA